MGKTQTPIQIVALLLLLVAGTFYSYIFTHITLTSVLYSIPAVVLNLGGSSSEGNVKGVAEYQLGLIMVNGI